MNSRFHVRDFLRRRWRPAAAVFLLGLLSGWAWVRSASGLNVKVEAVDQDMVVFLAPFHWVLIETRPGPGQSEIPLRTGEFYEAKIEGGRIDTVRRNFLFVDLPKRDPMRFRIRKIVFLEGSHAAAVCQ